MQNLDFAWRLLAYFRDNKIDPKTFIEFVRWDDDQGVPFYTPVYKFETHEELIIACGNNCLIAFGTAAITLNRAREEIGWKLPESIDSEQEQFVALVYQIRNAFAHDMAEPKWNITKEKYKKVYTINGLIIDLKNVTQGEPLDYRKIGGPETLHRLAEFFDSKKKD